MPDDGAIAQSDLRELLLILGMGDHARPQSAHEVFQEALGVLRERLEDERNRLRVEISAKQVAYRDIARLEKEMRPPVEALRCAVAALDANGIAELDRPDACAVITDALRDVVRRADGVLA